MPAPCNPDGPAATCTGAPRRQRGRLKLAFVASAAVVGAAPACAQNSLEEWSPTGICLRRAGLVAVHT